MKSGEIRENPASINERVKKTFLYLLTATLLHAPSEAAKKPESLEPKPKTITSGEIAAIANELSEDGAFSYGGSRVYTPTLASQDGRRGKPIEVAPVSQEQEQAPTSEFSLVLEINGEPTAVTFRVPEISKLFSTMFQDNLIERLSQLGVKIKDPQNPNQNSTRGREFSQNPIRFAQIKIPHEEVQIEVYREGDPAISVNNGGLERVKRQTKADGARTGTIAGGSVITNRIPTRTASGRSAAMLTDRAIGRLADFLHSKINAPESSKRFSEIYTVSAPGNGVYTLLPETRVEVVFEVKRNDNGEVYIKNLALTKMGELDASGKVGKNEAVFRLQGELRVTPENIPSFVEGLVVGLAPNLMRVGRN